MILEETQQTAEQKYIDISMLPGKYLVEVAGYIKEDTLEEVNKTQNAVQIRDTFYTRYGKRMIDLVLSFVALLLTLPVNLVIGIVTFFDVGTPLIFKQTRIGKDRKNFTIYKFRNMTNAKDANGDLLPPSQRVTKWGKFVRKTSLDELMNFVSIFKGDMSLIGPRPLISSYVGRMHDRHLMLYSARPGLECPFPEKLDHPVTWQDRLDNYAWYAQNVSFLVDIKLALRMVSLVFSHDSTAVRSVSKSGAFLGYEINGKVIDSNAVPEKYVKMLLKNHNFNTIEEAVQERYQTKA